MTSKEALEKLLNDINEQGQVITTNPNLMVNFNVNLEMFTATIENALKDLERLEALEKNNQELNKIISGLLKSKKELNQENEKLKKVIEIYTKISTIDKESTTSYLVRNGMITQQEYELLKEVLGYE